jgi:hypothetical protein
MPFSTEPTVNLLLPTPVYRGTLISNIPHNPQNHNQKLQHRDKRLWLQTLINAHMNGMKDFWKVKKMCMTTQNPVKKNHKNIKMSVKCGAH